MRIMGIDYGDKRIGIALSDETGILASGVETIRWNGRDPDYAIRRICGLAAERGVTEIVIGMPRRTDGRPGASADKAESLAAALEVETGLLVTRRDERYTTVIASRMMREAGRTQKDRNEIIDQIAAVVILQEVLDGRRRGDNRI
ncbi:MAG: Holliday junction resolvase RuvX [Clostridiaceae bacterium]|jgi:putative Holliday junction resolvase|nr:Holliday junction resolvase RuvX [Clostridiaceae bacterium]